MTLSSVQIMERLVSGKRCSHVKSDISQKFKLANQKAYIGGSFNGINFVCPHEINISFF